MKFGVIGSRVDNIDEGYIWGCMQDVIDIFMEPLSGQSIAFLSGGAPGVDEAVMEYCRRANLDHIMFKPYHLIDRGVEFTPRFYFARNKQIIDNSDVMLFLHEEDRADEVASAMTYAEKRKKEFLARPLPAEDTSL